MPSTSRPTRTQRVRPETEPEAETEPETLDGPPRIGASAPHHEIASRPAELTRSRAAIGSPRYMAPEQMASPRDVDARADIWSLGTVLFELVTGRAAFDADSMEGLVRDVRSSNHASVREIVPGAPEALDTILGRCLAVDRKDRFADIASLARALAPLASSRGREAAERVVRIGLGRGDSVDADRSRPSAPSRGRRAAWAGAAFIASCALAFGVLLLRRGVGGGRTLPGSSPSVQKSDRSVPSVSGPPILLPHRGECAELPAFVSDGSVVTLAREGPKRWIERVSSGGEPRTVVDCKGDCWYPAPGGEGRIVYAQVADATSLGLDLRSVALDGTDGRFEAARGRSSWRAGPSLFFVREDGHAIVRHAADGTADETLVQAPSARTFRALAVARDGALLVATSAGLEARTFDDVCFAGTSPGAALDCRSAGESSSQRPSFAPGGRAFYFARGRTLVRFDPDTKSHETAALPFSVTSLAVAPTGDGLVASTCAPGLELTRWSGGVLTRLPRIENTANELAIGPHGEMAYPVTVGDDVQLVVADESGEHTRVLTSGARRVTEAAFSPDGRRVAFADASKEAPGLFVIDAAAARSPLRLTSDDGDSEVAWLDDERLVYLHPSPGYAYGRLEVVSANGGAAEPLGGGDGILLGVERARHAILLVDWAADGTRFFERTIDGHQQREIVFAGAPRGMKTSFSGSSVSGRYITWVGAGGAWVGDVEQLRATRVPVDPAVIRPLAVYADDEGRVVVASRVRHGELYAIPGSFP